MDAHKLLFAIVLGVQGMAASATTAFDEILYRTGFETFVCPNGRVEDIETCDDGGTASADGCSDRCQVEFGFYCSGTPSVCATFCSDGAPAGMETCDDGNLVDGDGCSAQCQQELGFACSGIPSVCVPACIPTTGTDGNDTLIGTTGDDCISGLGGDDILQGNAGNDSLSGDSGNDTLEGGPGQDRLEGGAGTDTLVGGDDDDLYVVSLGDTITETSIIAGADTVESSISFSLGANVEDLVLTGTANIDGTGNALANRITGNEGDNRLNGLGGSDTLIGGAGNDELAGGLGLDTLTGGEGFDRFLVNFTTMSNQERVTDFTVGVDDMVFDMSVMNIGNGDTVVSGVATAGSWNPALELVIDTSDLSDLGTTVIGAEFSSATGPVPAGNRMILVARATATGDPGTGIYLFSSDGDADVEAAELTILAILPGSYPGAVSDFMFVP